MPATRAITAALESDDRLVRSAADRRTVRALAISLQALVIGFLISLVVGVPLVYDGPLPPARIVSRYLQTALLTVPMIIIPFLVIAFGLGLHSRVWIVFLFALSSSQSIRQPASQRGPDAYRMAKSFAPKKASFYQSNLPQPCR